MQISSLIIVIVVVAQRAVERPGKWNWESFSLSLSRWRIFHSFSGIGMSCCVCREKNFQSFVCSRSLKTQKREKKLFRAVAQTRRVLNTFRSVNWIANWIYADAIWYQRESATWCCVRRIKKWITSYLGLRSKCDDTQSESDWIHFDRLMRQSNW